MGLRGPDSKSLFAETPPLPTKTSHAEVLYYFQTFLVTVQYIIYIRDPIFLLTFMSAWLYNSILLSTLLLILFDAVLVNKSLLLLQY